MRWWRVRVPLEIEARVRRQSLNLLHHGTHHYIRPAIETVFSSTDHGCSAPFIEGYSRYYFPIMLLLH